MTKPIRLAVGIPAYGGHLTAEHARMWLELGAMLSNSHERFMLVMNGFADINGVDRARNFLLAQAMVHNADWLLMIDADTWVQGHADADAGFQLLRMISDADRADAAIVAAPVIRRVAKPGEVTELAVYVHDANSKRASHLDPQVHVPNKMSTDYDAVGTAVFACNLHKVNAANASFKFTEQLSEDLDFCGQLKKAGGKILVDGRVHTGHLSRSYPLLRDTDGDNADEHIQFIEKTGSRIIGA